VRIKPISLRPRKERIVHSDKAFVMRIQRKRIIISISTYRLTVPHFSELQGAKPVHPWKSRGLPDRKYELEVVLKKRVSVASIVILLGLFTTACGLLQEPEPASGTIEAAPVEADTQEVERTPAESAPTAIPTEVEEGSEDEKAGDADVDAVAPTIFRISQVESQVRFELDEDLRGVRQTVVGSTDQVAGEIAVQPGDPSATRVGEIRVNARTLATDNGLRNRAIQNFILDTGSYEFITFVPSAIRGLPDTVGVGDEVSFSVEGGLTIRDVTRSVTFEVVLSVVSETRMVGTASGVVRRGDFDLNIPSVPNVANVEEEVELYFEFVATA
jgi:polyisoprenoid-binding protein YceI